jgi:ATP-dependent Clp protease ATP-binding subunit ClpA
MAKAAPFPGAEEAQETPKAEAGEAKESALSKYCVDLKPRRARATSTR